MVRRGVLSRAGTCAAFAAAVLAGLKARGGRGSAAAAEAEAEVDCSRALQRIDGFGASSRGGFAAFERGGFDEVAMGVSYRTTEEQRRAMLSAAVRELGLSHLRVWIEPSGIELKNDNDDPNAMNWEAFNWEGDSRKPATRDKRANRRNGIAGWGEILGVAVAMGLENWIPTPGGLPGWLRHRMRDPADADRFEEYAEWAAAHLLYLKKVHGLEAPYWSMHNEADNLGWKSPGMWAAWIKATGRRLRKEGLRTKIMFPDHMNVYEAVPLAAAVMEDEEARRYVGALAYHHYRSSGDGPQPFLNMASDPRKADGGRTFDKVTGGARAMAELGRKYGVPSWQTETAYYPRCVKNLSEWAVGRGRANEVHYELISGASAVEGMVMLGLNAIDERYDFNVRRGGHYIVMTTDGTNVTSWEATKDAGAVFAHWGRFVRPGDRRVEAECADASLRVTAFVSERSRRCVVVVVNNAREAKRFLCRQRGLAWPLRHAGGVVTDRTRTLAPLAVVRTRRGGGRIEHSSELPPLSLCTLVFSEGDPGPLSPSPGALRWSSPTAPIRTADTTSEARAGHAGARDDFERADLGGNWTVVTGRVAVVNGRDAGIVSKDAPMRGLGIAVWTGRGFLADQFSEAVISPRADANALFQVFVRWTAEGGRYGFHWNPKEEGGRWEIKRDGRNERVIAAAPAPRPANGDTMRIEAAGGRLRGYHNGKLVVRGEDATLREGQPGMALNVARVRSFPCPIFDRWSGGDLE